MGKQPDAGIYTKAESQRKIASGSTHLIRPVSPTEGNLATAKVGKVEASEGIEPPYKDLQSSA